MKVLLNRAFVWIGSHYKTIIHFCEIWNFEIWNFVPKTYFAWNSTGLNSCVINQGQNHINFQCHIAYTALANFPRYNIEITWYPLRKHRMRTVLSKYVLCVHTKGLIPSWSVSNRSTSVYRPLLIAETVSNHDDFKSTMKKAFLPETRCT